MTKVLQATLNMVDLEIRDIIDKEHGRALGLPHPCAWRTAAPFEDCPGFRTIRRCVSAVRAAFFALQHSAR